MYNKNYFNRYSEFREANGYYNKHIPFIELTYRDSWKRHKYLLGVDRLDLIAQKYYSDPNLGWLILLANRDKFENGNEFKPLSDDLILNIPYPRDLVLNEYNEKIKKIQKFL